MTNLFYALIALAGGMGLSLQAAINSRLSEGIGAQPIVASFISFTVGAVCLGTSSLIIADWQNVVSSLTHQPWWRWLGGLLGATFVVTSVYLAPKLGITNAMFIFIIGQLVAGMLIDSFGLIQMSVRPAEWWKFAGLAIMLTGLTVFMYGDRLFQAK